MNIYQKLMLARINFQQMDIHKSGKNTYAGYEYFELSDFLPAMQAIFQDVGLCGFITFSDTLASLIITDMDKPEDRITIASPMATASLKGCHEIQNLGAVETYQRRYLWMTAFEVVEHDALDSSPGAEKKQVKEEPAGLSESQLEDVTIQMDDAGQVQDFALVKSVYGKAWKLANEKQRVQLQSQYMAIKAKNGWK